ncbi:aminodeoxychorismate synthase component I [Candidatus Dependentiae bacterium]|nr:aminodeoxychorismate synthase component I [Candidatus Dependentiae bacterium]
MFDELNYYGKHKIPVLFIIDYLKKKPIIIPFSDLSKKNKNIFFDLNGCRNSYFRINNGKTNSSKHCSSISIKNKISFHDYKNKFDKIIGHLKKGNSFLVNLTAPTEIELANGFNNIFYSAKSKYKMNYKNEFIFFSPETFIIIKNNIISTFPMKGTIRADIPDAEKIILSDEKESAEHITIVDLLRNDIGSVAENIKVLKFRYIDKIKTAAYELLQVSSEICGTLEKNWNTRLGDILEKILPAGSVTGAPKIKTLEIIKDTEKYDRNYYTGVCGYFDGTNLDSCVMIRFIENIGDKFFFKSGGGITIYSNPISEYNELIDKIYIPE